MFFLFVLPFVYHAFAEQVASQLNHNRDRDLLGNEFEFVKGIRDFLLVGQHSFIDRSIEVLIMSAASAKIGGTSPT